MSVVFGLVLVACGASKPGDSAAPTTAQDEPTEDSAFDPFDSSMEPTGDSGDSGSMRDTGDSSTANDSGDTSPAGDTAGTGDTAETGDTAGPPPPSAACAPTDNPLVFECSVTLTSAGPATLVVSAPGAATRTFESTDTTLLHEFVAWGLLPDTTYDWTLDASSGAFTTGSVPPDLTAATVTKAGTLFGIDAVLMYVSCGYFVMYDGEGQVIWFQPTTVYDSFSDGMRWSPEHQSVIAVRDSTMSPDTSLVQELDLTNTELLRLAPGDFDFDLTHDLDRRGPYSYYLGEDARIGGFEVFEGTTKLGEWTLTDGFPSTSGLSSAHVNGLTVDENYEVLISVHTYDAIVAVDGDPASPTFLTMLWHAAGNPGGGNDLPNPDYVPASGTIFDAQHNASRHGDELWVFDNLSLPDSRALVMNMDHSAGLITEARSWSVGQTCLNQGGAIPIAGGALATCANTDEVYAFRDGSTTADWYLNATCSSGGWLSGGASTRAYPVTLE